MDSIRIKDLEIYGHHGVYQEEKKLGQKFLLTIDAKTSIVKGSRSDQLTDTTSYGDIARFAHKFLTDNTYDLLETCVERLATALFLEFASIRALDLELKKPWAPIGLPLDYVGVKIQRGWQKVTVALGSNLGDPQKNLHGALARLQGNPLNRSFKVSELIETTPVGYADQANFLNGVVVFETLQTAQQLLAELLEIEADFQRVRTIKNGPRTLDLDLLLFGELILNEEELIIPHPRMHERLFVLEPLCELIPYQAHPIFHQRFIDLLTNLKAQGAKL